MKDLKDLDRRGCRVDATPSRRCVVHQGPLLPYLSLSLSPLHVGALASRLIMARHGTSPTRFRDDAGANPLTQTPLREGVVRVVCSERVGSPNLDSRGCRVNATPSRRRVVRQGHANPQEDFALVQG